MQEIAISLAETVSLLGGTFLSDPRVHSHEHAEISF